MNDVNKTAKSGIDAAKTEVVHAADRAKGAVGRAAKKVQVVGTDAANAAKNAVDHAAAGAGHATQAVGEKVDDAGRKLEKIAEHPKPSDR